MSSPRFSRQDYARALLSLLPRGRVWPKDPGAVQVAVMDGLAESFVRLDGRAQYLIEDAFPTTTLELLGEWEQSLGLPDACEGEDQTLQQRRAQVVSRLTNAGGQSRTYYIGVLEGLGYTNPTIREFAPFRADCSVADTGLADESWWYAWQINLPDLRLFYFCADISAADEALLTIANGVTLCVIAQIKPAHTIVLVSSDP